MCVLNSWNMSIAAVIDFRAIQTRDIVHKNAQNNNKMVGKSESACEDAEKTVLNENIQFDWGKRS